MNKKHIGLLVTGLAVAYSCSTDPQVYETKAPKQIIVYTEQGDTIVYKPVQPEAMSPATNNEPVKKKNIFQRLEERAHVWDSTRAAQMEASRDYAHKVIEESRQK